MDDVMRCPAFGDDEVHSEVQRVDFYKKECGPEFTARDVYIRTAGFHSFLGLIDIRGIGTG